MSLLEFAEKTSPIDLTGWQKEFLEAYEEAIETGRVLICCWPRYCGRTMIKGIINQYYGEKL